MIAWTLFYNPISLSSDNVLWLLIPLCTAVAVVYKTVRTKDLARLWREILALVLYMLGGLTLLAAGLWAIHTYLA